MDRLQSRLRGVMGDYSERRDRRVKKKEEKKKSAVL